MAEETVGMLMGGVAVKGVTAAVVKEFIDGVITPYLRGMKSSKSERVIKKNLSRYVKITEHRTRSVSTFINTAGVFSLEDVYEPLTIADDSGVFSTVVEGYPHGLFEQSRCVALTDDAGMGKSTLAKYIVRKAIIESKGIPLLIELRRVRPGQSILGCLCEELAGGPADSVEGQSLLELFEGGNFIFVLDGFDEVEEALRPDLVAEINSIAARFSFCYFILTSRPEYSVSLFPGFMQFGIQGLTREQAHSLIRRYDVNRGLAKILIPKIDQADVGDFLENPLLVTLIYRAFDHRNSVPPKRTIFFRQVYDALFQDHDLGKGDAYSRGKECGLDSEDFHKLLRSIGFETFKSGRVSYRYDELHPFVVASVKRSGIQADAKKVISDLLKAVPIFLRDGMEIKWSHKSFQEYFASQYILNDMSSLRADLIQKMFKSPEVEKYGEFFRFFGECDLGLMRELCILPYVEELTSGDEAGFGVSILSIHEALDIYYIGDVSLDEFHKSPRALVLERFNTDLEKRRTAVVWGGKGTYLLLGALKSKGVRLLLLPKIDPKMFPEFTMRSRSGLSAWQRLYGEDAIHVNPDLAALGLASLRVGGLEPVEAASSIYAITDAIINSLKSSEDHRRQALTACVLDEF